jgi:hypothetical protein
MIKVRFAGIDSWNRPVFKDDRGNYYGSVEILFDYYATAEQVQEKLEKIVDLDLLYFGKSFGCEPWGSTPTERLVIDWGKV